MKIKTSRKNTPYSVYHAQQINGELCVLWIKNKAELAKEIAAGIKLLSPACKSREEALLKSSVTLYDCPKCNSALVSKIAHSQIQRIQYTEWNCPSCKAKWSETYLMGWHDHKRSLYNTTSVAKSRIRQTKTNGKPQP